MFKTNCRSQRLVGKRAAVIVPTVFCPSVSRFCRRRDLKLVALSGVFTAEQKSCYNHAPGAARFICFTDVRGFSFGGGKLKIRHTPPPNAFMPLDPTPLPSLRSAPGKWL